MVESVLYTLIKINGIHAVQYKIIAGIPFLFVQSDLPRGEISRLITQVASEMAKGTELRTELIYVRCSGDHFIYRFRYLYPLDKSFCCGNMCGEACTLRK